MKITLIFGLYGNMPINLIFGEHFCYRPDNQFGLRTFDTKILVSIDKHNQHSWQEVNIIIPINVFEGFLTP
jgi:hypothetical protein